MKKQLRAQLALLAAAAMITCGRASTVDKQAVVPGPPDHPGLASQGRVAASYAQLPLAFEINEGQSDPQVKFLCRGAGYGLFLTGSETVLALTRAEHRKEFSAAKDVKGRIATQPSRDILRFKLLGANSRPQVQGMEALPGKSNYFIGNDPKRWRTNVPRYARVKSERVYPGIDLVYYGRRQQLEFDFQVAPGADPGAIRFTVAGARKVSLNARGDLILETPGGSVIEQAPIIYQKFGGERETFRGRYEVRRIARADSKTPGSYEVGFLVPSYDRSKPLVIDPVLVYSTYFGGDMGITSGNGIAVDHSGNAWITGDTDSANFPTTTDASFGNSFVTKLNAAGTLVYSTYLGGVVYAYGIADSGQGIAVDGSGNPYLTGYTSAGASFPTTSTACQTTFIGGGSNNAFVTKLNETGSALVYSTLLGGSSMNITEIGAIGRGIAVDGSGCAYVTGVTDSTGFPTTNGAYQAALGGTNGNAFVTKLNPNLSGSASLVYSTYLGGTSAFARGDLGAGIAVDSSGGAYVTGYTTSSNFPFTPGAFQTAPGGGNGVQNAFVTKLNPNFFGSASLVWSTYLGGSGYDGEFGELGDGGEGIAVDSSGNVYVTGYTYSTDFPTSAGALQTALGGSIGVSNAFVTKLNPNLSGSASLAYSTYLGGSGDNDGNGDVGFGIAVDGSGNAYVAGGTYSGNFPTTRGAYQGALGSTVENFENAFVTKLNPNLFGSASMVYSTYFGGSNSDYGNGIALGSSGDAYVTGYSGSAFVACFDIGSSSISQTCTVTPIAGTNGKISPNTVQTVTSGGSVAFSATPDAGYQVDQWLFNDTLEQTGSNMFSLDGIATSGTLEVTFSPATTYTITPVSGSNGSITPNTPQTITSGSASTFTATPDTGFDVSRWLFNGAEVQNGGNTFQFNPKTSGTIEVTFVPAPVPVLAGTYDGLLLGGSGSVTIAVSSNGKFTGKVVTSGSSYSIDGFFNYDGVATLTSHSLIPVSLQMVEGRVDAPGTYSITGTAKGVAFTAWHAVYSKDAVVPGIGKYTLLLKTSGAGAGLPRGSGYATMALGAKGGAALAGKLPDGENFSVTVPLVGGTAGNQLLIDDSLGYPFASPSAAKGSLLGALKEATTGTSNFSGTLAWTKPAQTKGDYPAEIDTNLNVIGSPYIPPTKGGSVLPGFTTGTLELSDTSGFVLSGSSQLTAANKLIINNPPDDLKVTVTPSSGVLKGSFLYPVPGKLPKLTNFSGVLFQDQIIGGGLFIGPDGSGSVSLTSP